MSLRLRSGDALLENDHRLLSSTLHAFGAQRWSFFGQKCEHLLRTTNVHLFKSYAISCITLALKHHICAKKCTCNAPIWCAQQIYSKQYTYLPLWGDEYLAINAVGHAHLRAAKQVQRIRVLKLFVDHYVASSHSLTVIGAAVHLTALNLIYQA